MEKWVPWTCVGQGHPAIPQWHPGLKPDCSLLWWTPWRKRACWVRISETHGTWPPSWYLLSPQSTWIKGQAWPVWNEGERSEIPRTLGLAGWSAWWVHCGGRVPGLCAWLLPFPMLIRALRGARESSKASENEAYEAMGPVWAGKKAEEAQGIVQLMPAPLYLEVQGFLTFSQNQRLLRTNWVSLVPSRVSLVLSKLSKVVSLLQ